MSEIQELSKWMSREGRESAIEAMMPKLMAFNAKNSRGEMPQIMADLMPKCLETLMPKLSKHERFDLALQIISVLVDKGTERMSEEEKKEFIFLIDSKIRP
jgi:hypothetical protein